MYDKIRYSSGNYIENYQILFTLTDTILSETTLAASLLIQVASETNLWILRGEICKFAHKRRRYLRKSIFLGKINFIYEVL